MQKVDEIRRRRIFPGTAAIRHCHRR